MKQAILLMLILSTSVFATDRKDMCVKGTDSLVVRNICGVPDVTDTSVTNQQTWRYLHPKSGCKSFYRLVWNLTRANEIGFGVLEVVECR